MSSGINGPTNEKHTQTLTKQLKQIITVTTTKMIQITITAAPSGLAISCIDCKEISWVIQQMVYKL